MSTKIDQAFIQKFIDGGFGLPTSYENENYTPIAGNEYIELINIPNDITPFSLNDSNETDGLFRMILRWPENKGDILAKLKADEILDAFKIGTKICYSDQCATVTNTSRSPGRNEDGWYKLILTIGYYANIKR